MLDGISETKGLCCINAAERLVSQWGKYRKGVSPTMKKHSWQTHYKVTNWSDYNRALINRGDLTLWVSDDVIEV